MWWYAQFKRWDFFCPGGENPDLTSFFLLNWFPPCMLQLIFRAPYRLTHTRKEGKCSFCEMVEWQELNIKKAAFTGTLAIHCGTRIFCKFLLNVASWFATNSLLHVLFRRTFCILMNLKWVTPSFVNTRTSDQESLFRSFSSFLFSWTIRHEFITETPKV